MALWRLEMACGHEEEHKIRCHRDEQERAADRLMRKVCRECWNEQARARSEYLGSPEAAEAAEQAAVEHGWRQLAGSEKQVAWASELRQAAMLEPLTQADQEMLGDIESAKWWIDNRRVSTADKIRQLERIRSADAAAKRLAGATQPQPGLR